jgi:hypothetical protein
MHFVAALDRIPGVRCVLGLFEGVVTGAADGYYRMAGKPAATLLHLGPGLGNGLANLHNASKARSGIVNVVGDHGLDHMRFESPLKSDAQAIAGSVSHWVRCSASAADVGADGAAAVQATRDGAVGRIATLLLPADTAWGGGRAMATPRPAAPRSMPKPCRPPRVCCSAWGRARCCCWVPAALPARRRSIWPWQLPPRPVAGCWPSSTTHACRAVVAGRKLTACRTWWTPRWHVWPAPKRWCWPARRSRSAFSPTRTSRRS